MIIWFYENVLKLDQISVLLEDTKGASCENVHCKFDIGWKIWALFQYKDHQILSRYGISYCTDEMSSLHWNLYDGHS